jgi:hypothetical protein
VVRLGKVSGIGLVLLTIFCNNVSTIFSGFIIGSNFNHLTLILAGVYFFTSIFGYSNPHLAVDSLFTEKKFLVAVLTFSFLSPLFSD